MTTQKKEKKGRVTEPKRKERDRKKWTADQIEERKEPLTDTVTLALKPGVREAFTEAEKLYKDALALYNANDSEENKQALIEAENAFEYADDDLFENTVEFVLVALGREDTEELFKQYPPTLAQIAEYQEVQRSMGMSVRHNPLRYDSERFPAALIHACLKEPEMTLEQVQAMWVSPKWNRGELGALFATALGLCQILPG
jgi:hypothetical protein